MAAPVKNLLNPTAITLVFNNQMTLPRMPWRGLEYAPMSVWMRQHFDYTVPRWTLPLISPSYVTPQPVPLIGVIRDNPGRIAQVITFPSVYKQSGSGSNRPSVGQQWPRGVK